MALTVWLAQMPHASFSCIGKLRFQEHLDGQVSWNLLKFSTKTELKLAFWTWNRIGRAWWIKKCARNRLARLFETAQDMVRILKKKTNATWLFAYHILFPQIQQRRFKQNIRLEIGRTHQGLSTWSLAVTPIPFLDKPTVVKNSEEKMFW